MANLIIVASGRATRLHPIHQDLYPKLLINSGQQLFIDKLIQSYQSKVNLESITIIVPDEKAENQIREAYINVKGLDDPIISDIHFIHHPKANGTAQTIFNCFLMGELPKENVIITWSDIYPEYFELPIISKYNAIFLDENPVHRLEFNVQDGKIYDSINQRGNIPGIFYISNLDKVFEPFFDEYENIPDGCDLTFIFSYLLLSTNFHFGLINKSPIIDTGDMVKYEGHLSNVNLETRYFNKIEFEKNTVTKSTTTEYGKEVLANEKGFYDHIDQIDPERKLINMPTVYSSSVDHLELERVKGETIHQHLEHLPSTQNQLSTKLQLLDNFIRDIQPLHEIKSPEMSTTDIIINTYKEYYIVTCDRLAKIPNILPEINFVNGIQVQSQANMLKFVHQKIEDFTARLIEDGMRLIHGDPNSSNVMIDEFKNLTFIDPRGRFGNLKLYGDPYYDYAKFLYGLTGYDEFNLTKDLRLKYNPTLQEITVPLVEKIETELDYLTDDDDLKFLVGLIWLKLPYYTINNLNKAIAAYAIGLRLITKYYK